jgi:hypothetical protein
MKGIPLAILIGLLGLGTIDVQMDRYPTGIIFTAIPCSAHIPNSFFFAT